MGTKTISIRDEVYEMLRKLRREDESFSDTISRLARAETVDIGEYLGILSGEAMKLDELLGETRKIRESAVPRE